MGRHPIYLYDGNEFSEVASLRGKRAFDFALSDSGDIFLAGDEVTDTEEHISVLIGRIDGEWETLVRHNESLFFGSVYASGDRLFALDRGSIWQGTCR